MNNAVEIENVVLYSNSAHITHMLMQATDSKNDIYCCLPESSIPHSITVIGSDGAVVGFRYDAAFSLSVAINGPIKPTGEVVTKSQRLLTGILLNLDETNGVLMMIVDQNIVLVREYESVLLHNRHPNASEMFLQPCVKIPSPIKPCVLSYMTTNVGWRAFATAVLHSDNTKISIRLFAQIFNNTGSNLSGKLTLVAGEPFQPSSSEYDGLQSAMRPTMSSYARMQSTHSAAAGLYSDADSSQMEQMEDYHAFSMNYQNLMEPLTMLEMKVIQTAVFKIYLHDTRVPKRTQFGYRFTTPSFIPTCMVQVYTGGQQQQQLTEQSVPPPIIGRYLGQCQVREKQRTQPVELLLGYSTMVTAESYIEKIDNPSGKIELETIRAKLSNFGKIPAVLIIKHYIGDRELIRIIDKDEKHQERDVGFITWSINLLPGVKMQEFTLATITFKQIPRILY